MRADDTNIIGINAYHGDSSACLIRNGKLIAACEEERFTRIKHAAGFPRHAIAACLKIGGVTLENVQHIAINRNPRSNLWKKVIFAVRKKPDLSYLMDRIKHAGEVRSIDGEVAALSSLGVFRGEIHHVQHHMAHLSSAYHLSPFQEAVTVSVDGFGDFMSAMFGIGRGTTIEVDDGVYFPHSLGLFYQALTQFIGFPNYGDEYKVMGLAPYGKPAYLEEMRQVVKCLPDGTFQLDLKYFRHDKQQVSFEWTDGAPRIGTIWTPELEELLGPARGQTDPLETRHQDIAASAQAMYEEVFFHVLQTLYDRHKVSQLCLAGGCAMNSVANGKVRLRTPFQQVYVQAAAGDAGGALGAALCTWYRVSGSSERYHMDHAYWGPEFDSAYIESLIRDRGLESRDDLNVVRFSTEELLFDHTIRCIESGGVVGWFQGRMEWGPRALGNRSILGDPRRSDMKDLLNSKIKRRESFRPFAPSVLKEHVSEWFEQDDDVPFMMQVFRIRESKRSQIPAVTHVDGTGRLQTVHKFTNPRYHGLIEAFYKRTRVPMLLNTSFNENEPVVCRPEEALDTFLRTRMDIIVLGDTLLERKS